MKDKINYLIRELILKLCQHQLKQLRKKQDTRYFYINGMNKDIGKKIIYTDSKEIEFKIIDERW